MPVNMDYKGLPGLRRWFEDFDHATWDLAAFYFGNRNDFTCDECVHVESGSGTKWSFLYKFAKSDLFQKKFARQYKQVCRREPCRPPPLHLFAAAVS